MRWRWDIRPCGEEMGNGVSVRRWRGVSPARHEKGRGPAPVGGDSVLARGGSVVSVVVGLVVGGCVLDQCVGDAVGGATVAQAVGEE